MGDSIFTKIIKGEIPAYKVYEDDKTLAFLDIHPKTPGHVLVVSKKEVPQIWDLTPEDYQAVMTTVKKVGKRLKEVLQAQFVGIQVEGIAVPHVHVHVFPFSNAEEFHAQPDLSADPNEESLKEMAEKLAF